MLDRETLFRYLGVADPGSPEVPDVYADAVDYGNAQVAARLEAPTPWDALVTAYACRYAARYLAARGAPLGQVDLGEFGAAPLYARDPELQNVQALYGRAGIA